MRRSFARITATLCLAAIMLPVQAATDQSGSREPGPKAGLEQAPSALLPAMVSIPGKNYEIGKYEVTQAEWRSVMGNNPSKFADCGDDCPVEKVSWDDAQAYIHKLNAQTGMQYRLPTEAEWEYACYGGIQSEYCGGNDVDAVAWTDSRGNERTHPVGQKQANGYGLYDMSGNVMEWTEDCWEGNCAQRVFRGGSWINEPRDARATYRIWFMASIRNGSGGFRLARTIPRH